MDSEFINVYIAKQKTWIEELVAKQIILETRLQIAEQTLSDRNAEIGVLKNDIEDKAAFINRLVESNAAKEAEKNAVKEAEKNPSLSIDMAKRRNKKPEHIHATVQEEVNDF